MRYRPYWSAAALASGLAKPLEELPRDEAAAEFIKHRHSAGLSDAMAAEPADVDLALMTGLLCLAVNTKPAAVVGSGA